jgi:hypothetical protein
LLILHRLWAQPVSIGDGPRGYAPFDSAARDEFWQRPPCKDGRHRFVARMNDGRWAVWVLQQVGPMEWQEVTAFTTSSDGYVQKIRDDCGLGSWLGHAYGG